jgi:signal transduction histidine kinase
MSEVEELKRRLRVLEEEKHKLSEQMERVQKDRSEYLQNVSHQLVAPLNAIKWHIENLNEGRIKSIERIQKVLRSVYSQATLAVHLAKNFNLMSNLEADHALTKLKEPLQEIQLCPLLINLADDFQPLAWDRGIEITVVKDGLESAPPILAMKPLISQVFSNIIENAVKYSNDRTEIVIEGRYVPATDSVTISIRNLGIVLQPEDVRLVFNRAFRTPEAQRKYPAGTGFGLYIARRIVEIHEGTITAATRDGWAVFEVTLSVKGLKGKARIRV